MNMLEVKGLKKYFATQKAVDDISFSLDKGSIFGLLGPNGAGKTTLIRMITGIFYPDEGEILFDGKKFDPANDTVHIGYMPEERGLYKKMKIGEQAVYLAQLKGLSKQEAMEKVKKWFVKFEMQSWWNKKMEDLSKGMGQKLQFVITVLHQPKLIILDEPFSGLDPVNSNLIKNEIFDGGVTQIKKDFKENKFSIQLSSLPAQVSGSSFDLIEQQGNKLVVRIRDGYSGNDVLQHFIQQQAGIEAFHEILPSLNEIFIREVEGTRARTRAFQPIT